MMKNNRFVIEVVVGIILLAIGVFGYIWISYYMNQYRDVPDDMVSWFHLHVIQYFSGGHNPVSDTYLRFIDGRNLLLSPILLDLFVVKMNLSPWMTVVILSLVYIFLVFTVSYLISKNMYVAGFSTMLFSFMPAFIYWFKYNMFGAYVSQSLWLVVPILLGLGLRYNRLYLIVLGSILSGILWLMWPGAWIILVVYSIYLSALIYKGTIFRESLLTGLLLLVFSLPLNVLTGFLYLTVYHIFSLVLLVSNIVIGYIEYRVTRVVGEYSRFAWRIIGSIMGYAIGLASAFLLLDFISGYGVYEDYYRLYNPLYDYGIIGILSIIAIIAVVRSHILVDLKNNFLEFVLIAGFIIGLIASYFDPTLTVFTASCIVPFVSLSLISIASFLSSTSRGWHRVVYIVVAAWILFGSILGNAIPSYALITTPPSVYYGDFTYEILHNKSIPESPLLKALSYIMNNTDRESLIISYWGFSYWIIGYIGGKAHTLADYKGSLRGQRIISWIMMSDENTAYQLIKKLIGNDSNIDVYVLVSEVVSIEKGGATPLANNAHIGRPIVIPSQTTGQTQVLYQPVGDIARIPLYLSLINASIQSYLDYTKARAYFEVPLAWKDNTKQSLVVKLVVDALRRESLSVINDVLSPIPVEGVSPPQFFKHVSTIMLPLYPVDTGTTTLNVTYMVALYKVETNIS
ncbi:hypothetical protein Smar_0642 [Staphylothermus marinus F1]|uniref:Uncharacterized protein n=2 Tax=Staphylothermus marinus TaxID=2280 RepID=A3DM88_STAMF|nr:hypothetical protein Smar_0642 [Staphylothermus marinus F1]